MELHLIIAWLYFGGTLFFYLSALSLECTLCIFSALSSTVVAPLLFSSWSLSLLPNALRDLLSSEACAVVAPVVTFSFTERLTAGEYSPMTPRSVWSWLASRPEARVSLLGRVCISERL